MCRVLRISLDCPDHDKTNTIFKKTVFTRMVQQLLFVVPKETYNKQ